MKIDHIAMYVNDLEGAKDFFIKYFGADAGKEYHNIKTDFYSYFLTFSGETRLEIMSRPDMHNREKYLMCTGFHHIALSVGSKEKVDEITDTLKKDGYEVISGARTTGDGYYESCVLGFEDNQIEITI